MPCPNALPPLSPCLPVDPLLPTALPVAFQLPESWDAGDVVRLRCPAGSYNDLATGMQSSAVFVIRSLLSLGSEDEPVNNRVSAWAELGRPSGSV